MTKFMVAFWHGGSLIERFWHERNINREFVLQFLRDRFPHIFSQGNNQKGKLFLQHNTPPRIERYSGKLWIIILAEYLRYPSVAWSKAHRKHISFCRRVSKERYHQEKDKKREIYDQFCIHVTNTLRNFPSHEIDWTIASMPKQTDAVYQNEKTKHKILKQEHYCRMVMLSGKN